MERNEVITVVILAAVMLWSLVLYAPTSPMVFAWGAFFGISLAGIAVLAGVRP